MPQPIMNWFLDKIRLPSPLIILCDKISHCYNGAASDLYILIQLTWTSQFDQCLTSLAISSQGARPVLFFKGYNLFKLIMSLFLFQHL